MQGHLLMQGHVGLETDLYRLWSSIEEVLVVCTHLFIFRFPGVQRSVCGLFPDEEISSARPLGTTLRERPAARLIR